MTEHYSQTGLETERTLVMFEALNVVGDQPYTLSLLVFHFYVIVLRVGVCDIPI